MVSKAILSLLMFESIEDYYDHILEKRSTGRRKQAIDLFSQLSEKQKSAFFEYAETTYYYEAHDCDEMDELQMLKNYLSN